MLIPTPSGGGKRQPLDLHRNSRGTMDNQNTLRRLKTVEGHLRGVIRMVEEDKYCIDVIRQIQAVEAALNKVSAQILESPKFVCNHRYSRKQQGGT